MSQELPKDDRRPQTGAGQARTSHVPEPKKVARLQLGLLRDAAGQSLQTRFENFCDEGIGSLTATNEHGEPVLEAGKFKATFTVSVQMTRTADDALNFTFDHSVGKKLPCVPSVGKSASVVSGLGIAEALAVSQMPLFSPLGGQPKPRSKEDVEREANAE